MDPHRPLLTCLADTVTGLHEHGRHTRIYSCLQVAPTNTNLIRMLSCNCSTNYLPGQYRSSIWSICDSLLSQDDGHFLIIKNLPLKSSVKGFISFDRVFIRAIITLTGSFCPFFFILVKDLQQTVKGMEVQGVSTFGENATYPKKAVLNWLQPVVRNLSCCPAHNQVSTNIREFPRSGGTASRVLSPYFLTKVKAVSLLAKI